MTTPDLKKLAEVKKFTWSSDGMKSGFHWYSEPREYVLYSDHLTAITDIQQDVDDARKGWEAAVEEVRNQDEKISALEREVETLREEAVNIGYVLCSWPGKDDLTEYGKGFNAGVQRYMDKLRALARHEEAAPLWPKLPTIADYVDLDTPPPAPQEVAWLVEVSGPQILYWSGGADERYAGHGTNWTADANKAVKFAGKGDAERLVMFLESRPHLGDYRACEHMWPAPPPAPQDGETKNDH